MLRTARIASSWAAVGVQSQRVCVRRHELDRAQGFRRLCAGPLPLDVDVVDERL
jgi:hypothetical protein